MCRRILLETYLPRISRDMGIFPREGRLRSDSTALSGTTAATLGDEYKDKAPDKNIIRQVVREAQKHLDLYFDSLDDSILFAEVEFSNRKLLLIELVVTASRHTTYNVGICDGALRDNGVHPVVVPYKGGEWGLPPSLKTGGGRS